MKRAALFSFTITAMLLFVASPFSANAIAQKQCKVKQVGTTAEELQAGVAPELWALIIGVSTYQFGGDRPGPEVIPNLQYAADDADAIYDFLRSDRGGAFRADHIRLLKDEEATKAQVESALQWLKQAKRNDYFVIFIAAHGAINWRGEPETDEKLPYFILYDTNPKDIARTGLQMQVFRRMVENDFPAKGLVMSDTCHSAGVVILDQPSSVAANNQLTEQMKKIQKAVGYLSAAYQTESSFEKDSLYHGVFTYCLLEALRGEADTDHNEIVTFNEVVEYLFEEVPKQTAGQQHITPATNNIDANCLPLSVARYLGQDNSAYGTLVIRNPDLEGVEFKIDQGPREKLEKGIENSINTAAGQHEISFTKPGTRNAMIAVAIKPGEMTEVKVEFSFSQNDADEASAGPARRPIVRLVEAQEPPPKAKKMFEEGVASFDKQQFKQAIEKFDNALAASADAYHLALVYRGRAQQSLGQQAAAIGSFAKAYRLKPSDYETETLLAEAKFDLAKIQPDAKGEVLKIANALKSIIRRDPKYDFARVVLADVLLWQGNFNGAERELRHAIAINADSPPAHMILADVLSFQPTIGKREEAIKQADDALRLFDRLATKKVTFKRLSLAHLIFGGGKYVNQAAMAEAHYVLAKAIINAVELRPGNREADLNRARESITAATKIAEALHDQFRLALVLATSVQNHLLKGDAGSAIKDGERALKEAEALNKPRLIGSLHYLLSQAYESAQNYCKSAAHQQGYIQSYGLNEKQLAQAAERLRRLFDVATAHRQKCGK